MRLFIDIEKQSEAIYEQLQKVNTVDFLEFRIIMKPYVWSNLTREKSYDILVQDKDYNFVASYEYLNTEQQIKDSLKEFIGEYT